MAKEYKLTAEQSKLLKEATEDYNLKAEQTQKALNTVNHQKKVIDDLITMLCSAIGFDKEKTKIDLAAGTVTEEDKADNK